MNLPAPLKILKDIFTSKLTYDEDVYHPKTINEIRNAYEKGGMDPIGYIWIEAGKLHSILRTNPANAKYLIGRIPEIERQTVNGTLYIYGPTVLKLLSKEIGNSSTKRRERYLQVSTDFYNEIQSSDVAKNQRAEFREATNMARAQLKKNRIEAYGIEADELTREPLQSSSQFSHIRAFQTFPEIGLRIENGLIVNKSTHALITKRGVIDEEDLLNLCHEVDWSTEWYEPYEAWLTSNGLNKPV